MALANSKIDKMSQYLGEHFYIPNYQRDYSWEEAELQDFWDDLEQTKNDPDKIEHFFGQIVVHVDRDDNDKKYIIDGQQRSISSVIFLRALQLCFIEIYKETDIEEANQKNSAISFKYIGENKDSLNLTLGEQDEEYFRQYIQLGHPDECPRHRKRSHEKLRKAFVYFYGKLKEAISASNDPEWKISVLQDYLDTFTERFKILYLEADKLDEAFVIFETLNARGKDLETADLLKNYIFSKFSKSSSVEIAQNKWNEMTETLDRVDPTKFIRHYWNSCHTFAREKDLYRSISKHASTPRDSEVLLNDLQELSKYYHDLVLPNDELEGFHDDLLVKHLSTLKTLKASTYYPIVLAMLKTGYQENDIRKVLERIEIYVFRNFTICGLVANTAEILFAKIALQIYGKEFASVDEICEKINNEIVSDEEFYDSFSRWTAGDSSKEIVRYILRKIHENLDSIKEININNTEVHIEHIMPHEAKDWGIDEETHEQYLWRLGNLALLSGSKNISISNGLFNDKKEVYAASWIMPNPEIATFEEWGPEEIETRQKQLADIALRIWAK